MDIRDLTGQAFYFYNGKVLARRTDSSGYELDPQPYVVRSIYISSADDLESSSTQIQNALTEMPPTNLLHVTSSPQGSPYRSARLFCKGSNDHLVMDGGNALLSWLTFTLCQKLRLVYKQTHPENALDNSRPVSPELALSVVQDLIEILRDLGHVKETSTNAGT